MQLHGKLPDGGHGLDAEEQGRGEVIDPSDALEQKTVCDERRDKLVTLEASKTSSASSFTEVLSTVGQFLQEVLDT